MNRAPLSGRRASQPHPLWLFEENYLLLRRLLPRLRTGACFVLGADEAGQHALQVVVEEVGPYTAELRLTSSLGGNGQLPPPLQLKVRIYHDAQLAEVIGYQDCMRIPPRYAARMAEGFQRDERQQVNHLLREVLLHCRRHGHVAVEQV